MEQWIKASVLHSLVLFLLLFISSIFISPSHHIHQG